MEYTKLYRVLEFKVDGSKIQSDEDSVGRIPVTWEIRITIPVKHPFESVEILRGMLAESIANLVSVSIESAQIAIGISNDFESLSTLKKIEVRSYGDYFIVEKE